MLVSSLLLVFCVNTVLAAQTGRFKELETQLASDDYPHVLGAKVTVGKRPKTLLLSSKSPESINMPVDIRSATKSITALLFGTGESNLDKKRLNTPISDFLPPDSARQFINTDLKSSITLMDLFSMRAGLACDDWVGASLGHEDKMYQTKNWLTFWSELPISHTPGKHFSYCTGNVIALGNVLASLQQTSVPLHAQNSLFSPLGIVEATWATTPEGGTDTGGHLNIGLIDLHKIGVLVLNQGQWEGQQIVNSDWLNMITQRQSNVPERREGYGLLWWTVDVELDNHSVNVIYAHGNGGNFIIVVPALEIVAAFTGNAFNSKAQFLPFRLLVKHLLPSIAKSALSK